MSGTGVKAVVSRAGNWQAVEAWVHNVEDLVLSENLKLLVKGAADALERHYPGWLWCIRPDEGGGIVDLFALRISGRLGYTLHTRNLQEDEDFKCVMRAGGELLERFGFPRGRYTADAWRRQKMVLGQFVPDISDKKRGDRRVMQTDALRTAMNTGHARLSLNPSVAEALRQREHAKQYGA